MGRKSSRIRRTFTPSFKRDAVRLLDDGKTATEGMLSGVLATEELVGAVAKMAQALSPDLCSGSTIEGIKDSIRQASDIMKDGMTPHVE